MSLTTIDLSEQAKQLKKPFEMTELAQFDELGINLYISHGRLSWHRHVDEDELFLVIHGMVTLDSEGGSLSLHAGELALIPKGVGHRSSSLFRSTVLLVRPRILAQSQNGHRRLFTVPGQTALHKRSVGQTAGAVLPDFAPHQLATIGAYRLELIRGTGVSPWYGRNGRRRMLLIHAGQVSVETMEASHRLSTGELAVVAPGTVFRLVASSDCTLLQLAG